MKKYNIFQFFKDETGQFSSNRLVFLTGFFTFFGLWIYQSINEKKIASIDSSVIYLLVVLMTGKFGQSISENFSPSSNSSVSTPATTVTNPPVVGQ
jgi:hypothetical protein